MLDVRTEEIQGVLVVRIHGDLDLATVGELREALADLRRAGHHPIAIDLGGVEYIDMTSIRVLEEFHQELGDAHAGGLALVIPPSALIRRVIDVIELPRSLRVVERVEDLLRTT